MAIPKLPTVKEIRDRIVSDIENSLNQSTPLLPKAFNRVLAGALAGVFILLYQAILFVYRSIFPDTADITALRLLGSLVDVEQLPSTFAVLTAEVGGQNSAIVSEGVTFRGDNNMVYKVTTAGVVTGGVATVSLTAQESGEAGNLSNGSILNIISPDPLLIGTAIITGTTVDGDDEESDDSFRLRISSAYKKRKTGGSPADYESWALETPNVDWASPIDSSTLPGDVIVYVKVDNQPDGIPTTSQLNQVLDYLLYNPTTGIRDRHPIGPYPIPTPINRELFDITITIQGSTPSIKTAVENAVIDYVENRQPFNIATSLTRIDTISNSGISNTATDVADPEGGSIISVILKQVSTDLTIQSYQLFGGQFGKVNSISWIEVA